MAPPPAADRHRTLDIDQDLDHVRRLWRVQRAGWVVMTLIVAAGVAGIFGQGPLARARAERGGLRVEYERFARHGATSTLRAVAAPSARRGDTLRLWIDREFLEGAAVEQVTPEPERVEARGDAVWFTFSAPAGSQPAVVTLLLRPDRYWSRRGRVGLDAGGGVAFRQFVYP